MVRGDLVARRLAGERSLAVDASATVLFALTMLAALGGYTATVTRDGLSRPGSARPSGLPNCST